MKKKLLTAVFTLAISACLCVGISACNGTPTGQLDGESISKESLTSSRVVVNTASVMPIDATRSGVCGEELQWGFDAESGTLSITGTGEMSSYSIGSAPWYDIRESITKIIVSDECTLISSGAFNGCNNLQEITLPFVGKSKTAEYEEATFGYIFGFEAQYISRLIQTKHTYTATGKYYYTYEVDVATSSGRTDEEYSGADDDIDSANELQSKFIYDLNGNRLFDSKTTISSSSTQRGFVPYKVSFSATSYSVPANSVWQYSDYNDSGASGKYLHSYYYFIPSSITKVTVTNATKIDPVAFFNCNHLREINLNDGIESIGDYAFRNCSQLDTFSLPGTLTSIGSQAMYNCDSITKIEIPNGVTVVSESAFRECDKLSEVKFNPNITKIESFAFYSCKNLKNVDLSEALTEIKDNAFANCTSFTEIIIPNRVTTIGMYAFSGCTSVGSLTIGNSVKTISEYSFSNLQPLKVLSVPNSVTAIKAFAFNGCNNLQEITLPFVGESRDATGPEATFGYIFGYTTLNAYTNRNSSTYKGIFNGNGSKCVGYTYYDGGTSYKQYNSSGVTSTMLGWDSTSYSTRSQSTTFRYYKVGSNTSATSSYSGYYYNYVQPSGTTWQYSCNDFLITSGSYTLQSYYYYIPGSVTKLTVTDATKIDSAALLNCYHLREINLNDGITSIGDYAFGNCGVISNSAEDLVISGDILIAYRGNELNVTIPDGVELIAPRAFENNKTISSVTFPKTVTWIGDYAFYNCTNAIVTVPKVSGSLQIMTGAFTNTGSVKYLDKLSYENGNDTFYYTIDENDDAVIIGCTTTSNNVTLPVNLGGHTVVAVGYRGMADCTTLNSVTIPNNILRLDLYAFAGCSGLTTATIPATCVYVGDYAFFNCTSLATLVIAEGVTYLGDYCFYNCTTLSEVVVPDSCEYLGKYAFYNCNSLESATIGRTLPSIEKYTFYNCSALETIVIGVSVTQIGDYAFYNTALTRVTTPNLVSIGDYAFAESKNLNRVTLRNGLLTIGDGAFMNDSVLSTINLPSSVTEIGSYAFYGCETLSQITIPENIERIEDYTFAYCSVLTTANINGTITYIGDKAFYNDSLSSFVFTEGLTEIGKDAFALNQLTDILLPNSLEKIEDKAFSDCSLLQTASIPDSVSFTGEYVFSANSDALTITIRCNTGKVADYILYNSDAYSLIIEDGITEIGDYAFAVCHELSKITFPDTLQKIGDYAFFDNRSYAELRLPREVVSIGEYAFARGYNFTKIEIPDSVETIGANAFYRDEAKDHIDPEFTVVFYFNKGTIFDSILDGQHIQHIIVNDNIFSVGNNAFSNCPNLIDISLPDTIATFGQEVFANDPDITMSIRKVDGYIDDEIYNAKLSGVKNIYTDNINIGNHSFSDNIGIVSVVFTENGSDGIATQIGSYAFYNCNSITTFTINGIVGHIGEHAFHGCKALQSMLLPDTVNYIGPYAFYDCNSMASVNIPYGVEKIHSHTFYGCASLGNISTPDSVTGVEEYAFYGCVMATSINLSQNCKEIGEAAFYNCKALESLIIPNAVSYIGDYAFRSCVEVQELDFSDTVEEIGAYAFYDCNALTTVRLGKKIVELKDSLFYGCVNLTSLYVNAPLSYIDVWAFYGAEDVTVYCGRDEYMINFFDENGINYVIDDNLIYEYKIVFEDYDGRIISSNIYAYGAEIVVPTNPTREADYTYTYEFLQWDKPISTVKGNATYKAQYTETYIEYEIEFKNYDGTTLQKQNYHWGDEVTPPVATREADNTYTYAFSKWDKDVVSYCAGSAIYQAQYTGTYIEYEIEFKNYDGSSLQKQNYHWGEPVTPPTTPMRDADNIYTYTFSKWDSDVVNCAGNKVYTAQYAETYIEYEIEFKNYDGSSLQKQNYHWGATVTPPDTPTRKADNTYTYAFSKWDSDVVNCNGSKVYTAQYTESYIEYEIEFKNYDGTTLQKQNYHWGDPVTPPDTPQRDLDNAYTYAFSKWDKDVVSPCAGSAIYQAEYTQQYIEYEIEFKNYDGSSLQKQNYHWGDPVTPPDTPTRNADNTYTYAFSKWDSDVVNCNGSKVYTAQYTETYIEYEIEFKNYDGSSLQKQNYHWGDSVTPPDTPTRNADNTYTYAFSKWDSDVVNCAGAKVYTAQYTETYIEYEIEFKNYDGTTLQKQNYHWGDEVTPPVATREADNIYTYTFSKWDSDVVNCAGNKVYTAQYTETYIEYEIEFKNYDGSSLQKQNYHWGDEVTPPSPPTRETDQVGSYSFNGWDPVVTECNGKRTYTAQYDIDYIEYEIEFKNYDGTTLQKRNYHWGDPVTPPDTPQRDLDNTYTYAFSKWDKDVVSPCAGSAIYQAEYTQQYIEYEIEFKNYDGTTLQKQNYHWGDEVTPPIATREADNTYTYAFSKWDSDVVNCDGAKVYTAQYTETYIEYEIEFKNYDGSSLQKQNYHWGDEVTPPTTPTKDSDDTYTYTFSNWDSDVVNCAGAKVYTAQYTETYIEYEIEFKNYDGTSILKKNYHWGDEVTPPSNPTRVADDTYTYTFSKWDKDVVKCAGNAVYKAEYTATPIDNPQEDPPKSEDEKQGLSGGAIAGITVGSVAGVASLGGVAAWFIIKKKRH